MGDLIQFSPRSRQKADRAFWIGPDKDGEIANAEKAIALAETFVGPVSGQIAPPDDCA